MSKDNSKQQKTASPGKSEKAAKPKGPVPNYGAKPKQQKYIEPEISTPIFYHAVPVHMLALIYIEREDILPNDMPNNSGRQIAWTAAEQAVSFYKPDAREVFFEFAKKAQACGNHLQLLKMEGAFLGNAVTFGNFDARIRFWNFVKLIGKGIAVPGVRMMVKDDLGISATVRAKWLQYLKNDLGAQAQNFISNKHSFTYFSRAVRIPENETALEDSPLRTWYDAELSTPCPQAEIPEGMEIHYHPLSTWVR